MKVFELIAALQKLPQNKELYLGCANGGTLHIGGTTIIEDTEDMTPAILIGKLQNIAAQDAICFVHGRHGHLYPCIVNEHELLITLDSWER